MKLSGWWFGTWLLFSIIYGIILPIDFHIFQRDWNHQPVMVNHSAIADHLPFPSHRQGAFLVAAFLLVLTARAPPPNRADVAARSARTPMSPRKNGDGSFGWVYFFIIYTYIHYIYTCVCGYTYVSMSIYTYIHIKNIHLYIHIYIDTHTYIYI